LKRKTETGEGKEREKKLLDTIIIKVTEFANGQEIVVRREAYREYREEQAGFLHKGRG